MRLAAIAAAAAALAAGPATAGAERPTASARISAGVGALDELTWTAPGVGLGAGLAITPRVGVELRLAYAPIDNHTYLSDARLVGITAAASARLAPRGPLRVGVTAGLEHIAFHADPDILAERPATDLLARRSALLPTAGVELAADHARATFGVFARVAARRLELVGDSDGGRRDARLVLAGAFAQVRIF